MARRSRHRTEQSDLGNRLRSEWRGDLTTSGRDEAGGHAIPRPDAGAAGPGGLRHVDSFPAVSIGCEKLAQCGAREPYGRRAKTGYRLRGPGDVGSKDAGLLLFAEAATLHAGNEDDAPHVVANGSV